jgi:protein KRI1
MRQVVLDSTLNPASRSRSPEPVPHVVEQRALRKETIAAFHQSVQDEGDDSLFVPREKTKDEMEREEEEYRAFLEREVGKDLAGLVTVEESEAISSNVPEPAPNKGKRSTEKDKRTRKEAPKQETDQECLMKSVLPDRFRFILPHDIGHSYILNRGWIDRTANRIPTYHEVTSTKDKAKPSAESGDDGSGDPPGNVIGNDLDEYDFEEIVDRFESSYNFRFEEP